MGINALDEMRALRDRIRQRLEANQDFRALRALEQAIEQVETGTASPGFTTEAETRSGLTASTPLEPERDAAIPADTGHSTPMAPPQTANGPMSQIDYTILALRTKGHPLSTADLIPEIEKLGRKVGGKDPKINLASILSKSKRVKALRWGAGKGWWPTGEPLPELAADRASRAR